jgi:hypothetical protein
MNRHATAQFSSKQAANGRAPSGQGRQAGTVGSAIDGMGSTSLSKLPRVYSAFIEEALCLNVQTSIFSEVYRFPGT